MFFDLQGRRRVTVGAYEPSKQFRDTVRALRPGDRVRVTGSLRASPRTLNLERLEVLALAESVVKRANPRCPSCGRAMKSVGFRAGYRCPRGHARAPPGAAVTENEPRTVALGLYEPPACARRHLAKPIQRILGRKVLPPESRDARAPQPLAALAAGARRRETREGHGSPVGSSRSAKWRA